jgi:hypothetical protein
MHSAPPRLNREAGPALFFEISTNGSLPAGQTWLRRRFDRFAEEFGSLRIEDAHKIRSLRHAARGGEHDRNAFRRCAAYGVAGDPIKNGEHAV